MLEGTNIDYTSMIPEAIDARVFICNFVQKYQIDVLVIGKHKPGELRHHSK